ncbi:MAG: hypothetical protein ACI9I0_000928 [Rhodoferax sp.]|jgi:hypothetical protein
MSKTAAKNHENAIKQAEEFTLRKDGVVDQTTR